MNIFGLFFSFFVPGVIVGMMIMACIYHEAKKRRGNCCNNTHANSQL